MEQIPEKNSFQIILHSDNEDDFSEYWQDQCKQFYDDLFIALPEDSIKPLILESIVGEKTFDIISYSTIIITDIAEQVASGLFIKLLIDTCSSWSKYLQNDYIMIKYSDESFIKISKSLLSKLQKYSEENPQLSIFEVLNHFKNSQE